LTGKKESPGLLPSVADGWRTIKCDSDKGGTTMNRKIVLSAIAITLLGAAALSAQGRVGM
jgi:hypothetical protein